MTRLSVLEDAKVKLAAYENMKSYDGWGDDIVHALLDTIKGLVCELESQDQVFANFSQEIYFNASRDRFVIGRNAYVRLSSGNYPWKDAGYKYYGLLSSHNQVEIFLSGREAECLT